MGKKRSIRWKLSFWASLSLIAVAGITLLAVRLAAESALRTSPGSLRQDAPRRALRPISCRSLFSCKKSGEVHVKKPAERPFRRALPPFSCRQPCTSPVSLHEFAPLQGFGGSARHRAGIEGKCMAGLANLSQRSTNA